MGLFDSILGAASGEGSASGQANPLIGIVERSPHAERGFAGFGQ